MKGIHTDYHTVSVVLYLANEVIVLVTVEAGMVSDAATAIKEIDGVQKIYNNSGVNNFFRDTNHFTIIKDFLRTH